MTDRWLSVEEIAEYIGVKKDTVYAWINNKGMPGHRLGRFWKFKKDEINKWVHSCGESQSSNRVMVSSEEG